MTTEQAFSVDYDHDSNRAVHTVEGALETLRILFPESFPKSVLDVGCGTGTWLRAALDCGASEILGVDGVALPAETLFVAKEQVLKADLNRPVALGRRFELVLCLETVEHLEPASADTIVDTLTAHGDRILFSAAAPGQPGTHHVNCRWPAYWQGLFNARGYVCDDSVRWVIWDNPDIEVWYRQNLMMAVRHEERAGEEPRIKPVLHPEFVAAHGWKLQEHLDLVERGALPWWWYALLPFRAAAAKLRRRLRLR